jgi:hypothetical protein
LEKVQGYFEESLITCREIGVFREGAGVTLCLQGEETELAF